MRMADALGGGGNADRDVNGYGRAVPLDLELIDGGADALGDVGGGCERGFGQQHDELFAAHARGRIRVANAGGNEACDAAQHFIADFVAELIVDALEVVDVEQHEGERPAVALVAYDLAGEDLIERTAVAQVRERIALGRFTEPSERMRMLEVEGGVGRHEGQQLERSGIERASAARPDGEYADDAAGAVQRQCSERPGPRDPALLGMGD